MRKCKLNVPRVFLQVTAILIGSLALLTSGIQFAWTSPFIPILTSDAFPGSISFEDASYFTVIPPIAAIIFSPIFSKFTDLIGRKHVLILTAPVQIAAYVLIYYGRSVSPFYISRFLSGIGDAIVWSALPIYVGEISDPQIRGTWGNIPALSIYFGQLYINILGSYVDLELSTIISGVIPIVFFIAFMFMPESPHYLLIRKNSKEAKKCFSRLTAGKGSEEEFKMLKKDVNRQLSEKGTFKDLIYSKSNRRALLIALISRAANQFSGIAAFSVYTQYMFEQSGQNISKELSSIVFTAVLLVLTTISALFQDKLGRRPLMIISCLSCGVVLFIEAIYFYVDQETAVDVSSFKWLPLAGMMLYLICFSIGLSLIPTLLMGELFSASVKANAIIVTNVFFNALICIITKIFQTLTYNFGLYTPFLFFSLFCFLNTFLTYYFMLETRGKTLEEIQQMLKK